MRLSDEKQCLIITKLLVEAGCSPCERDADDKPPVHNAVLRGFISVVDYLLSQGVPLPSRILFAALQATLVKRVDMIRLLISKGANVHVLSPDGDTLLHVAVRSPDRSVFPEIVQILVDAGCSTSARNLHGETPFHVAERQEYSEIAIYLLLFDTPSGVLSLLGPDSSKKIAILELIHKVNGLCVPPEEARGLLRSVERYLDDEDKLLSLVKMLPAIPCCDYAELFRNAVQRGFCHIVDYFLSQHLPLPLDILFTALHHQQSMIPLLIRKGAYLHAKAARGDTLIHVAILEIMEEARCLATTQVLVEAGCHSSMPNTAGERPIHVAVFKGFLSVVEYLYSLAPRDSEPDFCFMGHLTHQTRSRQPVTTQTLGWAASTAPQGEIEGKEATDHERFTDWRCVAVLRVRQRLSRAELDDLGIRFKRGSGPFG